MQCPEDIDGFFRGGRPADRGGDQGAAGLQLPKQPVHALLFIQIAVGLVRVQVATDFVQGVAVAGAFLADIQAGKAKAENMNLGEERI